MQSATRRVFFSDFEFNVGCEVYEPAEDSFLFAENLQAERGERVADVGTGCGILGILAAVKAEQVVAIDINPYAVKCAEENARLNHVADRMLFIQGDLFTPLKAGETFDLILFNAPYLPSEGAEGNTWHERAWSGGFAGRKVIDDFLREAPNRLKSPGKILLMQSSLSDIEQTKRVLHKRGLKARVVARQDLPFFETIVLFKAELQP